MEERNPRIERGVVRMDARPARPGSQREETTPSERNEGRLSTERAIQRENMRGLSTDGSAASGRQTWVTICAFTISSRERILVLYTLAVVWFHRGGHKQVRFPKRPWYRHKKEASFADILTTLRRVSVAEKTATMVNNSTDLKTWLAQITELLVRAG
jgi:hypothetical protein